MHAIERSDDELLSETRRLIASEHEQTAKLVLYLAEIEDRRLHLLAGYGSMFDFCVNALGLSENAAFRRILAARLGRRFPVIHSHLASGAVHLSTLELLRSALSEENHAELLEAVSGKPKRAVEAMLAERFPKPDAPSRLRPLSEDRFKVEFTASAELRDKLELCRDLMSHANPSRDLGRVIERAVDLLLADLEKKRLARAKRPARPVRPGKTKRITNAARRKVFERDGATCLFVAPDGRRCQSRAFLELDHIVPRALGGPSSPENLRVLCRAHNQLVAERAFGRDAMVRARNFGRQKYFGRQDSIPQRDERWPRMRDASVAKSARPTHPGHDERTTVLEKVRRALRTMGFRDKQARLAVATVARSNATNEILTLEEALREALRVAA